MKKVVLGIALLTSLTLVGCSSGDSNQSESSRDYTQSNTQVKETGNEEKSEASIIVEKVLKDHYKIDNFKVNFMDKDFKVNQMPDDKNSDTGEVYKNLYNVIGTFTYQDKKYEFDALYSLKNEKDFSVIHFYTKFDETKTIDIPLESDK